jgi:tankyrase
MVAVYGRWVEMLQWRIDHTSKVPSLAFQMLSELFKICCEREPRPADQRKRLIKVLKAGADVHATDKNGVTALHHAVRFRSPAAVRTLIEHGADVNQACRRKGSTPLHRAVTQTGAPGTAGKGEMAREIVEILLAAGADPSLSNQSGKTPAEYVKDDAIRSLLVRRARESARRSRKQLEAR